MFEPGRTLQLIKGAVFDAEATGQEYLPEAGDWQKTAILLTGPLIVIVNVVAYLISWTSTGGLMFAAMQPTILSTILNIVFSAIMAGVIAAIFGVLAGAFGGKNSFSLAFAATTLAFVPGYIGQALVWLPWIGGLLAVGLGIWALVRLWHIIPAYLVVPSGKRAAHYVFSLLASIVVMFILSTAVGRLAYGTSPTSLYSGGPESVSSDGTSGLFGGVMHQAELMAAADEDRYAPPADGKLTKEQVERFIRTMDRVGEVLEEKAKHVRQLSEKAERDEEVSISDLSTMMTGVTEVAGMNTVEIEIVKSGGGNWAEHQWVKQTLRAAWLQKDINEAVKHNYALYQEFEDELKPIIVR